MKLHAERRERVGTSASKQARSENKIPAVVYGSDFESTAVLVDAKELEDLVREMGRNAVFEIELDGESHQVLIKEVDRSALKPEIYNVDLQVITKGQKVMVSIPVVVEGTEDVKEGVLTQSLNELEVEVLPAEIPSEIPVYVQDMEIGDIRTVADLEIPEGVTVLTEGDTAVVLVSAPQLEEEPEEGADVAADMPEPEVIGEDDE